MFDSCTFLNNYLSSFSLNDNFPFLFHVTLKKNLDSILKNGLKTSYFGYIHGSMDCQPKDTIYLSKFELSNNLNSRMFELDDEFVSFKIDTSFLDINSLYPDDAFFSSDALESVFDNVESISETFKIPMKEAEICYNNSFILSPNNVDSFKIFALWYLQTEGEISTSIDIPPEAIVSYLIKQKSNF